MCISKLDKYYINSKELYKKVSKDNEITPFDLPAIFLDYLYVKEVNIVDVRNEGETRLGTPSVVFKLTHKEDYPLIFRIPDKTGNIRLIEEFKKKKGRRTPIDGIFCKIIPDGGQLSLYPLGIINENQILYPNLIKSAQNDRAL